MIDLKGPSETLAFGATLYEKIEPSCVIFLIGELGSGKTTLVRGFLQAAGFTGAVKSPTFTLVEEYKIKALHTVHFDLYRLEDPEELEWIGIRDYLGTNVVSFIEWPQKGQGFLPDPDLTIVLQVKDESRLLETYARTSTGKCIKRRLKT